MLDFRLFGRKAQEEDSMAHFNVVGTWHRDIQMLYIKLTEHGGEEEARAALDDDERLIFFKSFGNTGHAYPDAVGEGLAALCKISEFEEGLMEIFYAIALGTAKSQYAQDIAKYAGSE